MQHQFFRRLRDPRGRETHKGWAALSLEHSIHRVLLVGTATWSGVMVLAAITSLGWQPAGLAAALINALGVVAALLVLRTGRGAWALIVFAWASFLFDWSSSPTPGSALLFASCWLCNINAALPTFLLRGRVSWALPVASAVITPVCMVLLRPEWLSHPLVPGFFVTTLTIALATRVGLSCLVDYAAHIDQEARELEAVTASLATQKAATSQAAEDARLLHDTAINTLGAIANGGVALKDIEAVRQRCRADVAAVETLRSTQLNDEPTRLSLREVLRPLGIKVRHAGLSDAELAEREAQLPDRVLRALAGATAEAVQNAAKHSGAEEVEVAMTGTPQHFSISVADQGVGMRLGSRRGSGVERSILARAREAGIEAAITSVPGKGTTVTLSYRTASDPHETIANQGGSASIEALVSQLRQRAVFALSAGLVGVGVVLSIANHPGKATPEWLMVLVVGFACGLAWRERARAALSRGTVAALVVSAPVAFVFSAWSVGFGQTDPILWQAIAPTGPLLALLILPLAPRVKRLGFGAYLLTVVAAAIGAAQATAEAAQVTVVAGLLGLGLVMAVLSFLRSLSEVAARAFAEQQASFALGLQLSTLKAAAEARRRWRAAGLEQSVKLLRAIGEGALSPTDESVQRQCAAEEGYLRQVSLLNPELIHMGTWFASALNTSRLNGVALTVRTGVLDASADTARVLGQTLLKVVDSLPRGSALTIAFFRTLQGLTLTLVAPTPRLLTGLSGEPLGKHRLIVRTLGTQDLAEVVVAGEPA